MQDQKAKTARTTYHIDVLKRNRHLLLVYRLPLFRALCTDNDFMSCKNMTWLSYDTIRQQLFCYMYQRPGTRYTIYFNYTYVLVSYSEYHTQLANMSFDEILDLTAGVYFQFDNTISYFVHAVSYNTSWS